MADITDGTLITGIDFPPSVTDVDDTLILNTGATSYIPGSPEVGTVFVAPTSGRVRITVGAGLRDSSAVDRIFISPQVFHGIDSTGTEVVAPSVPARGYGSSPATTGYQYGSRTSLLEGLTPGDTYYARVMHVMSPGGADLANQTDISARDITVIPVP